MPLFRQSDFNLRPTSRMPSGQFSLNPEGHHTLSRPHARTLSNMLNKRRARSESGIPTQGGYPPQSVYGVLDNEHLHVAVRNFCHTSHIASEIWM